MNIFSAIASFFNIGESKKLSPIVALLIEGLTLYPESFGVSVGRSEVGEGVVAHIQYSGKRKYVEYVTSTAFQLSSLRISMTPENIWIGTHHDEKVFLSKAEKLALQDAVELWLDQKE